MNSNIFYLKTSKETCKTSLNWSPTLLTSGRRGNRVLRPCHSSTHEPGISQSINQLRSLILTNNNIQMKSLTYYIWQLTKECYDSLKYL